MDEKIIVGEERVKKVLEHYGVKGMRWGVRRRPAYHKSVLGRINRATSRSAENRAFLKQLKRNDKARKATRDRRKQAKRDARAEKVGADKAAQIARWKERRKKLKASGKRRAISALKFAGALAVHAITVETQASARKLIRMTMENALDPSKRNK